MAVLPASIALDIGSSRQFTFTAADRFGNQITDALSSWSVAPSVGEIESGGVVTAGTTSGFYECGVQVDLVREHDRVTGTADISIKPDPLASVTVSPSEVSISEGVSQTFTAFGFDDYGNEISDLAFLWGSSGGGMSQSGVYSAGQVHALHTVTASANYKNALGSGSAEVSVVPTAYVQSARPPRGDSKPAGTINYGVVETGIFDGHPRLLFSPRIQYVAATLGESLVTMNNDGSASPSLASEWTISADGRAWTWKIRDDVEFHKGFGRMTVDDILYTFKGHHEGALGARSTIIGDFWVGKNGGSQTVIDDFTVVVDTGDPWLPARAFDFMRGLGGVSPSIVSKKQSEESTIEDASKDIAMTGPWEIESHIDGEYWRFKAAENHWRQTPFFEELYVWTTPEESARVAGFQKGNLDTFQMAPDSLPTVEAVPGTVIISLPDAWRAGLNIYGQTYGTDRDGIPYAYLDSDNPWVSTNEDTASGEWAAAIKVKKAMAIAIDREAIVDSALSGHGRPLAMRDWMRP